MKLRIYEKGEWNSVDESRWTGLADASCGVNPFYEPWNLLPALDHFANQDVRLVALESSDGILALLPVVSSNIAGFSGLKSWKHRHCFLNTPLFESPDVLTRLISDLLAHTGASFLHLDKYHGDIAGISDGAYTTSVTSRAGQCLDIDWDTFLSSHSKGRRKEYSRNIRKAEANGLKYEVSCARDDPMTWLEDFIELESLGWKGANNSAIKCDERVARYYRDVVERGWPAGKIEFQRLTRSGAVVASSIRCVSRHRCHEIKVCFDENLRHLSPGVVLELMNLKGMLDSRHVFADSCASPDDGVLNRMWLDEAQIRSTVIFGTSAKSRLARLVYGSWRSHKYGRNGAPKTVAS